MKFHKKKQPFSGLFFDKNVILCLVSALFCSFLDIFGLVLVRFEGFRRILVQDNLKQVCSRFRKYLSWYVCVCRCSSLWPEVRLESVVLLFHFPS